MLTVIWILCLFATGFAIFFRMKISFRDMGFRIKTAFFPPRTANSGILLAFFLLLLLFPLVAGMEFFLRTDANVLVVIFFLFWIYQWIKIVWNSEEKKP